MQFLIAEDNLVNQQVLKRILVRLGFSNIDIVGDGQQAVVAATERGNCTTLFEWCVQFLSSVCVFRSVYSLYS